MMHHHTKSKGDLGVLKAQLDLFEQGFIVCVPFDKGQIDIYCIYCPDTDECYYLDPSQFGSNVSLRVGASRNGQRKRIRLASDFRRVP